MGMYNGKVIPSVLYGNETWEINVGLRKNVDVIEMSCLRPVRGVNVKYIMKNNDIRQGAI